MELQPIKNAELIEVKFLFIVVQLASPFKESVKCNSASISSVEDATSSWNYFSFKY